MNLKDVVTFIITDSSVNTDETLNALWTAVRERQRLNRANSTAIAKATLRIGDVVSVSGISPKYLNGMTGRIVAFNKTRSRADIEIVDNRNDYRVAKGARKHGYPVQCLTVVSSTVPSALVEGDTSVMDFLNDKSALEAVGFFTSSGIDPE